MSKDSIIRVRCLPQEKKVWYDTAGGVREFSSWARGLLNGASGRPKALPAPKGPKPPSKADADRELQVKPCLCGATVSITAASGGSRGNPTMYSVTCPKCGPLITDAIPSNCSGRFTDAVREWNRDRPKQKVSTSKQTSAPNPVLARITSKLPPPRTDLAKSQSKWVIPD